MTLKLTDPEIAEIRRQYEAREALQKELAAEYGVSQGTISMVVSRRLHTVPRQGAAPKGRIDSEGRECSRCSEYKPWSEYYTNRRSPTGRMAACKACRGQRSRELTEVPFVPAVGSHATVGPGRGVNARTFIVPEEAERQRRDLYLRYMHGISIEQYEQLAEQQGHKCAICLEAETVNRHDSAGRQRDCLSVDHDHGCGRHSPRKACAECIRGLLCDACNRLIGFVEGRGAVVIIRFADYLGRRPLSAGGGEANVY